MTFHPVGQQNGWVQVHMHCFWKSQNLLPSLDQSVARHVGFCLSKMRTPSSISLTMTDLDSSNKVSSSSFQRNVEPGLRSS